MSPGATDFMAASSSDTDTVSDSVFSGEAGDRVTVISLFFFFVACQFGISFLIGSHVISLAQNTGQSFINVFIIILPVGPLYHKGRF